MQFLFLFFIAIVIAAAYILNTLTGDTKITVIGTIALALAGVNVMMGLLIIAVAVMLYVIRRNSDGRPQRGRRRDTVYEEFFMGH